MSEASALCWILGWVFYLRDLTGAVSTINKGGTLSHLVTLAMCSYAGFLDFGHIPSEWRGVWGGMLGSKAFVIVLDIFSVSLLPSGSKKVLGHRPF